MRLFFLLFCIMILGLSQQGVSYAQDGPGFNPSYTPKTTADPVCFTVESQIRHTVYAQIVSNYYQNPDGSWARHRHNFRIKKGQTYPVCTQGPFYDERKMLVKVKSLIPLFSCYFDLGAGGNTLTFYTKTVENDVKRIWGNCEVIYPAQINQQ